MVLTKTVDKANERFLFVFALLPLMLCGVLTGGLHWHSCTASLLLLAVGLFLRISKIKITAVLYSIALVAFLAASLVNTKGDFQTGLYETEKMVLFLAALLLGTTIEKRIHILHCVCTVAFICAVFGILAYCGLLRINEFVMEDFGQRRLQSFLKYANAVATLLAMGYFASLELFRKSGKSIYKYAGAAVLLAMYLTLSKAAIPLFFAVGLYYICRKKETAPSFVNENIITCTFALLIHFLAVKHMFFFAFWTVIACIASAANVKPVKRERAAIALWMTALFFTAVAGIVLATVNPDAFTTLWDRIRYMKDSLPVLLDAPLFGYGPGSWRLMKYSFQSGGYNTIYMHNGFLQLLFENGLIYLILFLVLIIKAVAVSLKKGEDGVAAILLVVILHSFVDFDLSFGVILMIVGFLAGSVCFEKNREAENKKSRIKTCMAFVPICIICVAGIYMITEYTVRGSFENDCVEQNYSSALNKAYYLENLCPKDSILQLNIAALLEKTGGQISEGRRRIERACRLSPYDTTPYEAYVNYSMTKENVRDLCVRYIYMRPKNEATYRTAKAFTDSAYSKGLINEEQRTALWEEIESIRKKMNVADRDKPFKQIANQRKEEM